MALQSEPDAIKAEFKAGELPYSAPASLIEVVHRATAELKTPGVTRRILKKNDRMPAFRPKNMDLGLSR